jgi:hypothetical protein
MRHGVLAERGIDVSKRTVLRWVQTFGPLLAAEARKHRRGSPAATLRLRKRANAVTLAASAAVLEWSIGSTRVTRSAFETGL